MTDNFIKRFTSDSQDGRTELEREWQDRYFYSAERHVDGMTWEDYKALKMPAEDKVDMTDYPVQEFGVDVERELAEDGQDLDWVSTQQWIKNKTDEERMAKLDSDLLMETFSPLEEILGVEDSPEASLDEIAEFEEDLIAKAIDPGHYKDIIPGYQYFDLMDHMLTYWSGSQAHALGNAYKYLMRCGKKDNPVQEIGKAIWYLERLKEDLEKNGKN